MFLELSEEMELRFSVSSPYSNYSPYKDFGMSIWEGWVLRLSLAIMIFLCTESYIPLSNPKPTNSKAFSGFNNLNILAKDI